MTDDETRRADAGGGPEAVWTIAAYKILGRIGRGGMADVLLGSEARADGTRRPVVVKRVRDELLASDPSLGAMLLDEARLALLLEHPNVVRTFGVGRDGAAPYIAMEYLNGQTLTSVQRRAHAMSERLPLGPVVQLFADVMAGLHYAHEARDADGQPLGVIHRDVTPSNIIVQYDGVAKLVDFGIAKAVTQRERTVAGVLKGKLRYLSPEQLQDRPLSRAVDVWAVAVNVWETLASERLFSGRDDLAVIQAVLHAPIPRLASRRDDVPEALDAALARALVRDPAARTQTAEQLRRELLEVARERAVPRVGRGEVAAVLRGWFADAIAQNERVLARLMAS